MAYRREMLCVTHDELVPFDFDIDDGMEADCVLAEIIIICPAPASTEVGWVARRASVTPHQAEKVLRVLGLDEERLEGDER